MINALELVINKNMLNTNIPMAIAMFHLYSYVYGCLSLCEKKLARYLRPLKKDKLIKFIIRFGYFRHHSIHFRMANIHVNSLMND
ncbi:hypothetical protein DERF_002086 [Dermatophagoides farinae]|uniref:Uncharacterized protein n=1 Tax=Dermatophagoides farinae TaxID=6954 RepID=A0A922LD75_DERFA|nr:hypothetical protein DERF_002086 [Dermatophagoides farinae]